MFAHASCAHVCVHVHVLALCARVFLGGRVCICVSSVGVCACTRVDLRQVCKRLDSPLVYRL